MRVTVQRVSEADVTVDTRVVGAIGPGLLVYVGVGTDDGPADVVYVADKIAALRIFNDDDGKMNRDVRETTGDVLVISAFALQADARKGRRPSFDAAAEPALAKHLYEELCAALVERGLHVEQGVFRAPMKVRSINDGPICVLLDSKKTF